MDVINGGSFDSIGRYDIVEPAMSMEEGNLPICDIISWCPLQNVLGNVGRGIYFIHV